MHEQKNIGDIAELISHMAEALEDIMVFAETYLASSESDGKEPVIDLGKVQAARTVLDRFYRTIKSQLCIFSITECRDNT